MTPRPSTRTPPRLPAQEELARYPGAVVLDPHGVRIGELVAVRPGAEAVLRLHAPRDVFGLFDLGGEQRPVPAEQLLWGPRRVIGATMVVLTRPS